MKVVGIIASPRKNGNCDIITNELISNIKNSEATIYNIDELNIEPCHACGECGPGKDCVVDDDAGKILEDILEADLLVFSTPIYYGQMSAQGKLITDRFYSISTNPKKHFENKKCVLIATHGAPTGVYDQYMEMTKGSPFGHVGFEVTDIITAGNLQKVGDATELEPFIKQAQEIASKF
ncbi:MAG: NAD(P)H-dependent oxidoreductase [Methanobacteriaceae archaeon]|nr:NAD(P)H-dependent oxidoreductase [Methanobacteriaceae archaeon]